MKMKLLAAVVGLGLISAGANAATGTITINGLVNDVTCDIDINGTAGGDSTITLPTVTASDLTATNTAGAMPLTINAKACVSSGTAPTGVRASFETSNVNPATGNLLNNTTTGGAKNVEVQITNAANQAINLITPTANEFTAFTGTDASMVYHVQYVAPVADAEAGIVTSSVVYSLDYQ